MKDPNFKSQHAYDFLTEMIQDETFNNEMIVDESMAIIGAATQTTTFLISNFLYYMTKMPELRKKVLNEIETKLISKMPIGTNLTDSSAWIKVLANLEVLDSCPYILNCINETLRIAPASTSSSGIKL